MLSLAPIFPGSSDYSLSVLVRITGCVEGLPNTSVTRTADYFHHATDLTAKLSLHYVTCPPPARTALVGQ